MYVDGMSMGTSTGPLCPHPDLPIILCCGTLSLPRSESLRVEPLKGLRNHSPRAHLGHEMLIVNFSTLQVSQRCVVAHLTLPRSESLRVEPLKGLRNRSPRAHLGHEMLIVNFSTLQVSQRCVVAH